MKAVTMQDLFDIQFLSDIKMSPDGRYAAFVVTRGSIEDNNYKSNIWLCHMETGSVRQLTALDAEKNIAWMDNENIVFPSARDVKDKEKVKKGEHWTPYYAINIHGGEAQKCFSLPLKSGALKMVSNTAFLTVAQYDNNRPDFAGMADGEREKALKLLKEEQESCTVFDEIPFWANGKGVVNKIRSRLYICDIGDNSHTPISPPLMNVAGYSYDRDGARVIYHGVEYDSMMERRSILHIYDINTNTDVAVPLHKDYSIMAAEILNGEILFYGLPTEELNPSINYKFYTVPVTGGEPTLLSTMDISLGNVVATDCKYGGGAGVKTCRDELYYISTRDYSSHLFKISKSGGEVQVSADVTGYVDCFDMSRDYIVFIGARNKGLGEVYAINRATGEEKQLTDFNGDWLNGHAVSYPEHFEFKNRDGVTLDGFVIKPVGYESGKSYPAILDMHGGPKVAFGDVLFHEMQLWAGKGYFVFFTNPRGSDGKGSDFANINGERYGVDDFNDFMDFTDKVLALYPQIDDKRVGVTGGSYGGLMTNWIVGHTDRFAAAAAQRSIANFISKCLTTDIGYYHNLSQMGTDPWNGADIMWDHSPLKYADKCTTPLLFIHSDEDYRCYMADAFQMFTALKMFGIDTRLCLFHGENHELSRSGKPKNRIRRLTEITDWFEKYLNA